MFRRSIMSIKRSLPIIKRTCNNGKNNDNNIEDFLRANSVIQHTKDEIIQEVKTILKKELKKEMDDDKVITNYMILFQFIATNLNILIATM